ncbi:hypothetical protein SNEBB_005614 [Seison nebaliae]|nr:hypothetical protein SNEBB_005614 [Seison nebaliae]
MNPHRYTYSRQLSDVIQEMETKFHFVERWMNKFHYIPIHLKDGIIRLYEELNLYHYASTQEFDELLNSVKNYEFFTEKANEKCIDTYCNRKVACPSISEISDEEKFQQMNNKSGFESVAEDISYNPEKNSPVESRDKRKNTPSEAILEISREQTYIFVRYGHLTIEYLNKN